MFEFSRIFYEKEFDQGDLRNEFELLIVRVFGGSSDRDSTVKSIRLTEGWAKESSLSRLTVNVPSFLLTTLTASCKT